MQYKALKGMRTLDNTPDITPCTRLYNYVKMFTIEKIINQCAAFSN